LSAWLAARKKGLAIWLRLTKVRPAARVATGHEALRRFEDS
jgi:hypothetical protein